MSWFRPAAVATLVAALVACSGAPTDVSIDMDTRRIDRATAEKAVALFRTACAPLFTTHAADVRSIGGRVSDDTSTAVRRLGWGVHVDLTIETVAQPTTLRPPADGDPTARILIGGGTRPGYVLMSSYAAALCDRATPGFVALPALAGVLPTLRLEPNDDQRQWYAGELKRAMEGEYQGQRNIAWCYFDGCDGVEPIDDVAACAWRLVILAARHPKADESDVTNVETDCRAALTPAQQATARTKADGIFRRIYKSPLPR